ncbi:hypothetical protein ACFQRL_00030 [Microbacterium fluvii]|uniref:Uncharacterized protein n=1 Tax=Microbacterium fluvii TaxID=415215 RepID=A0ABW2HA83_9MICO|nr:hypothetical protein [Microbacterium fluvii]MCU4670973.1 hypothetical protein [Microbacterium fluvii]
MDERFATDGCPIIPTDPDAATPVTGTQMPLQAPGVKVRHSESVTRSERPRPIPHITPRS